jgi:hypothetical protein
MRLAITRVTEFERDLEGASATIDAECRHPTEAHRADHLKLLARFEERGRAESSRYASSPPDSKQCIHAIVLLRCCSTRPRGGKLDSIAVSDATSTLNASVNLFVSCPHE